MGSKGEMMLLSGLLVAAAALVPLGHIGFRDALQALLKSFDIAVEQYVRVSGTHWYELELTATDHLTLERIQSLYGNSPSKNIGLLMIKCPSSEKKLRYQPVSICFK